MNPSGFMPFVCLYTLKHKAVDVILKLCLLCSVYHTLRMHCMKPRSVFMPLDDISCQCGGSRWVGWSAEILPVSWALSTSAIKAVQLQHMQQPRPLNRHYGQVVWKHTRGLFVGAKSSMHQMAKNGAFTDGYLLSDSVPEEVLAKRFIFCHSLYRNHWLCLVFSPELSCTQC